MCISTPILCIIFQSNQALFSLPTLSVCDDDDGDDNNDDDDADDDVKPSNW